MPSVFIKTNQQVLSVSNQSWESCKLENKCFESFTCKIMALILSVCVWDSTGKPISHLAKREFLPSKHSGCSLFVKRLSIICPILMLTMQ